MAIDGIGKPPSSFPTAPSVTTGAVGVSGVTFQVPAAADSADTGELLGRLQRGELTGEQYVDARVEAALSPLSSKLDPQRLEFVRATLREQVRTDPLLVYWVEHATKSVRPGSE